MLSLYLDAGHDAVKLCMPGTLGCLFYADLRRKGCRVQNSLAFCGWMASRRVGREKRVTLVSRGMFFFDSVEHTLGLGEMELLFSHVG